MSNERQSLSRVLGRTDVIALALGTIIGWGWIMLAATWVNTAGMLGAIGAFVLGASLCVLVGLTYAELTAALPLAGGEMVYAYRALGYNFSWFASWTVALAYLGVAAWEGIAIATAVDYLLPLSNSFVIWNVAGNPVSFSWAIVGACCAVLLSFLNYFGARPAAIFQVMATLAVALVGFMFVFGGITYGDLNNIGPFFTNKVGFLAVLMMVPSMLIGFDIIPQSAEEMNLPRREVGKVLVASIIMGAGWYILMIAGISLSAPEEIRNAAMVPVADAMSYAFGAKAFGELLIFGGIFAILTSWNGFMLGATRIIFAMGRAKMLPSIFGKLNQKHKTPTAAICLVGAVCGVGPLLGQDALIWLVNVSAFTCILAYLTVAISFVVLRKKEPSLVRPFKVRGGTFVGNFVILFIALFAAMYVVSSPVSLKWPYEWIIILVWYGLGIVFMIQARRRYGHISEEERELLIFGYTYARVKNYEK